MGTCDCQPVVNTTDGGNEAFTVTLVCIALLICLYVFLGMEKCVCVGGGEMKLFCFV